MGKTGKKIAAVLSLLVIGSTLFAGTYSSKMNPRDIRAAGDAVASWQIAHFAEFKHKANDWTNGALYRGLYEWAELQGEEEIIDFMMEIGKKINWSLGSRPFHADDMTAGQTFILLSERKNNPKIMQPTLERAYYVANHPSKDVLSKRDKKGGAGTRWSWCDALFMAPPVYAKLYVKTGDPVYLEYLDSEYKACCDSLYDKDASLFYRDCFKIPLVEENGARQFWGRGNGWVFGGLALIIDILPEDCPSREFYVSLFKEMAESVLRTQQKDGSWRASLLYPEGYPYPENSASSFFTYGLAWGLNRGFIKGSSYEKAVKKGWESLVGSITPEGKLGYVQKIAGAPGKVAAEQTEVYGTGAFLLAASEIYRMVSK